MAYTQKDLKWAREEVERQKEILQGLSLSIADHANLTNGEYIMIAMIKHDARRTVAQLETVKRSIQSSVEYIAERTMKL